MSAEQQQGTPGLTLNQEPAHPNADSHGGTGPVPSEARQALTAFDLQRALTGNLMEQACQPGNIPRAYKRVRSNQGSPGVDKMSVHDLADWLREHSEALKTSLRDGSYQPQPARGVQIPKPDGGQRPLGIPTAIDRLVQQMILQVLDPLLDPTFSDSSYGFRPGRRTHQALEQAGSM